MRPGKVELDPELFRLASAERATACAFNASIGQLGLNSLGSTLAGNVPNPHINNVIVCHAAQQDFAAVLPAVHPNDAGVVGTGRDGEIPDVAVW